MFLNNNFGKTVDILHRTMNVATLRREVISNNIANSDVPNFKRSDVNFEASLKNALESEKRTTMPALVSNEKHMSFYNPTDYRTVRPRRVLDYLTQVDENGNNVDPEKELIMANQNQMMYELMAESMAFQFRQINIVTR